MGKLAWKIYFNVFIFLLLRQVSATDPDCGVNAIVNYTLGEGVKKLSDFEIRSDSGEVCISGDLDYEMRSSYEFPIIATDRGKGEWLMWLSKERWTNKNSSFFAQVAWVRRRWWRYNWPMLMIIGRYFIRANTMCLCVNRCRRRLRLLLLSPVIRIQGGLVRWLIGLLLGMTRESSGSTASPARFSWHDQTCCQAATNRIIVSTFLRSTAVVCEQRKTLKSSSASSTRPNVHRSSTKPATTSPSRKMPKRTQLSAPSRQRQATQVSFSVRFLSAIDDRFANVLLSFQSPEKKADERAIIYEICKWNFVVFSSLFQHQQPDTKTSRRQIYKV